MNFSERSCKKCLISWKSTKNHRFRQNLQLFEKTTMFLRFDEPLSKRFKKMPHFVKMHENSSIWPKLCNFFEKTTMSLHLDELFRKKLQEVPHFEKKHEKPSIWPKLCNFSNKLPCLCISLNFSGKSCKKCLISWNSTKNHWFGQGVATFGTSYNVFFLLMNFQEKVAKSVSSREKARKIIDFVNMQLSEKTTMFWRFDEHCSKKLQKAARAVKKHEKSSIWPNLCNFSNKLRRFCISMNFQGKSCQKCFVSWKSTKNHRFGQNFATFRTNYHVFAFRSTFREKVAQSASFRETARKIIDLAKALQLLEQATMSFSFWWTFKKKVAKSVSSREKARKIIDFVNMQLSEKTTMFWRFDEHCSKKLQKAARAVKKHEKSSIWPNLCNFSNKLRRFCISMNFQGKSCQTSFVSWKSTKNHRFGQNFATFRANYNVLAFRWSFQQKVTKSASFREKARKIVDLAKTSNLSNKPRCFDALVNFSAKSCRKCLVFWENFKNHRLGQNFQLFRTKYHVYAFRWTFQQKVANSASFREKARKIVHLAKNCNFSNKLPCFGISMNFSGKKCKKWPVSWKSMFSHFDDYSRKKLQKGGKSGSFREKWRKIIDLA